MNKKFRGRPSKFKEEMIKDAELLAGLGLTQEMMAVFWGIDEDTLTRYKQINPEFLGALEKGKQNANIKVSQKLFQLAQNGNLSACIFWLTNRCPELWSDRRAVVNNTIVNNPSKAGANGSFIGEDRELQARIKRDLSALFPK
jgi:DNA-binding XRE family transcriptional regulator